MRLREPLFGVALLAVAVVVVASLVPALDDLWVENPGWNGLSEFYREVDPVRVRSSSDLLGVDPLNSTLFLVGPSRGFTVDDVAGVRGYLEDGGRVVLLDDFGSGNELLEGLGLDTRFTGALLRDGVFFDPVPEFPRLLNFSVYGVETFLFNYGSTLSLGEGAEVLVRSSPLSYVEDGGLVSGAFPVVARVPIGGGVLVLVSDSSVWLNCMIDRSDNRVLLEGVLRGVALLDVGHSVPTRLLAFKWWLMGVYGLLSVAEVRYGLALLLVLAVFRLKLGLDDPVEVDEVGEILARHPDWSRERLMWLKERLG